VSGRRAFGAEAVLDPARREKEVQFSDPPREKEKQADSSVSDPNTIQVPLSGINKKRDHGPIMVQGWRSGETRCRPGNQVRLLRRGRRQKDIKFTDMILSETEMLSI
jgi:hypothetical protein